MNGDDWGWCSWSAPSLRICAWAWAQTKLRAWYSMKLFTFTWAQTKLWEQHSMLRDGTRRHFETRA